MYIVSAFHCQAPSPPTGPGDVQRDLVSIGHHTPACLCTKRGMAVNDNRLGAFGKPLADLGARGTRPLHGLKDVARNHRSLLALVGDQGALDARAWVRPALVATTTAH